MMTPTQQPTTTTQNENSKKNRSFKCATCRSAGQRQPYAKCKTTNEESELIRNSPNWSAVNPTHKCVTSHTRLIHADCTQWHHTLIRYHNRKHRIAIQIIISI